MNRRSSAAANLLKALGDALEAGDADRARRRLAELDGVIPSLPRVELAAVRQSLEPLLEAARELRAGLQEKLRERPGQRRSVDAYRNVSRQV